MTALLTDNLPLLAGAPNGIKKLRELILELAVRGKLVPQDPSDEPARELMKRIAEEKARLLTKGKIKKQKSLAEISDDEKAFELPTGWMWARLGDICLTQTGTTPSKSRPELFGSEVPFIKPGDIYPGQVDYSGEGLSSLGASQNGRIAQAGSLLMVCIGTIGKCNLIEQDCSFNQQINSATLYQGFPQYLRIAARSAYFQAKAWSESSSTTIAILNKGKWEAIPLPLPGLAEQHRIVAKVDELMALCDRLETQQADAESAHAQLVQALLNSLTQASDADDFVQSWQRLAEHFHTLFTTESSIDALKQTLLQLAVMGKLVPQDPCDEPASELLKRITEKKARLVAEGKLKVQKPLSSIEDDEALFELPSSWAWARFGDTCAIKGELVRPEDFPSLRQVAPDCIEKGTGRLTDNRTVKDSGVKGPNNRFFAGQIVYSKIRPSLSKAVLVDFDGLCSADMYPIDVFISSEFLLKEILSEVFLEQVRVAENRIKMPKLNQESLTNFVLPIPPLAEQHRIVAKVDQLMALCDELKSRVAEVRQVHEQLAITLVKQAVA